MSELENNTAVDPNATVVDPKVDPKQTDINTNVTFDPEKELSKEQWKAIYESGRFKTLNERAQKAAELEKAQKAAEDAKLAEEGKFKELAESKDRELTQMQTAVLNAEIKAEAARLGANNPTIVANAINRDNIKFDKGSVTGVDEAVEALKLSDPYLFNNSNNNRTVGNPSNPGTTNNGTTIKMSQIRDPKFYRENRSDIFQAMRQGRVEQD